MSNIIFSGPIALVQDAGMAVKFTPAQQLAGTATPVKALQIALNVAPWGEDNRFPQNVANQLQQYGIGKAALGWKSRVYWGNGIIPGKVVDYKDEGKTEVFEPLNPSKYKAVYSAIRNMHRFWLEFLQDWSWYANCFPEVILSNDAKTITGFVHQESCDARFKQMDENGRIHTVYLSKLWGAARDQYAKFDPEKRLKGLVENPTSIQEVDNKFVKSLPCIDMYNPTNSLVEIAANIKSKKGLKSAILPVNFPSVNKTYYQVADWDGARLGGWISIAISIPEILNVLFDNAVRLKYHIEVPETFFTNKFGFEKWHSMNENERLEARKALLGEMREFLTSAENSYKTFVSFYQVDTSQKWEYGQIKINSLPDKIAIDKEILLSSVADQQFLISANVHPALFGAGTAGTGIQRTGGSDIREAWLTYLASLNLERRVLLEPLYLMRDYNRISGGMSEWEEDIEFRFRDTILTTLDTGRGTTKTIS